MPEILYGLNTINSLLGYNSGRRKIYEIVIDKNRLINKKFKNIKEKADSQDIPVKIMDFKAFTSRLNYNYRSGSIKDKELPDFSGYPDRAPDGQESRESLSEHHEPSLQSIAAIVSAYSYYDLETELAKNPGLYEVLVILDGITDAGNFGAIIRNCSAFGADGIIIPKKRSAGVNYRTSKISSGALEEVKVFSAVNLVRAIKFLKEKRFWIYGTTLDKKSEVLDAEKADYAFPMAIVFGSEHKGMSRLVEENCDFLINIKMPGRMDSLNVSTAAGIFLYLITKKKG